MQDTHNDTTKQIHYDSGVHIHSSPKGNCKGEAELRGIKPKRLKAKNRIVTPHIAWITKEARERIMDVTVKNVEAFLEGKPINKVN